jgi:hypothetical protein
VVEHRRLSDGSTVTADRESENKNRNGKPETEEAREIREVRASDIEPYTGLRYLSKLFRFMAIILVVLLIAEVATGLYAQGSGALPTLLGEASRLIVLAGVLWGTGDLAHLLIDMGHDVRAGRILMARIAHNAKVAPLSAGRTPSDNIIIPRRNFADRIDNGDEGPPIP